MSVATDPSVTSDVRERPAPDVDPPKPKPKPVSQRKRAANRANAAKSTGPRTPEGKAKSSMNAVTHGLTATRTVVPGESEADWPVSYTHLTLPTILRV